MQRDLTSVHGIVREGMGKRVAGEEHAAVGESGTAGGRGEDLLWRGACGPADHLGEGRGKISRSPTALRSPFWLYSGQRMEMK